MMAGSVSLGLSGAAGFGLDLDLSLDFFSDFTCALVGGGGRRGGCVGRGEGGRGEERGEGEKK